MDPRSISTVLGRSWGVCGGPGVSDPMLRVGEIDEDCEGWRWGCGSTRVAEVAVESTDIFTVDEPLRKGLVGPLSSGAGLRRFLVG